MALRAQPRDPMAHLRSSTVVGSTGVPFSSLSSNWPRRGSRRRCPRNGLLYRARSLNAVERGAHPQQGGSKCALCDAIPAEPRRSRPRPAARRAAISSKCETGSGSYSLSHTAPAATRTIRSASGPVGGAVPSPSMLRGARPSGRASGSRPSSSWSWARGLCAILGRSTLLIRKRRRRSKRPSIPPLCKRRCRLPIPLRRT